MLTPATVSFEDLIDEKPDSYMELTNPAEEVKATDDQTEIVKPRLPSEKNVTPVPEITQKMHMKTKITRSRV